MLNERIRLLECFDGFQKFNVAGNKENGQMFFQLTNRGINVFSIVPSCQNIIQADKVIGFCLEQIQRFFPGGGNIHTVVERWLGQYFVLNLRNGGLVLNQQYRKAGLRRCGCQAFFFFNGQLFFHAGQMDDYPCEHIGFGFDGYISPVTLNGFFNISHAISGSFNSALVMAGNVLTAFQGKGRFINGLSSILTGYAAPVVPDFKFKVVTIG